RALDGVQGAEGGIDQIGVLRIVLEVEQSLLELVEEFAGFLAEGLCRIGQAHAPVTFLITATSWSCLNGLTIQPVAPAARASALRVSSDSVVSRMIGMPLLMGCWRYLRMNSMPFITGMLRSVMTACTG